MDNLRNPDGTVGTPIPLHSLGTVYCDACGTPEAAGITDVYHPDEDRWERGVACPMHNPRPHPLT